MRTLIYLVGEPGVGKSTLMAKATSRFRRERVAGPVARDGLYRPLNDETRVPSVFAAVELGGQREGGFSGTDVLPPNSIKLAYSWLATQSETSVVLGEGAKLATAPFFEAARDAGYCIRLISLYSRLAPVRRHERAQRLGKPLQSESWVKGQITRMHRFVDAQCALVRGADQLDMWALSDYLAVDSAHERLNKIIIDAIRKGNE
jgi:P-loop Nucleotide Kinase3